MRSVEGNELVPPGNDGAGSRLVYRQKLATRITHWTWAICLFFLLLSGFQIFNAHPTLYFGSQSGFDFNNSVISIGGFPGWATIPSQQDLATGRIVHFFFAWILVFTLLAWAFASIANGHLRRDILPGANDLRRLPQDVSNHLRFRFDHSGHYNVLQKISYASILLILLPLMILTGLCMSPGMNAFLPWLVELFGGRQTARTIHFAIMTLLVLFFVIHILMVFAAGPINELRSMITGWYRRRPSMKKPAAES